MTIEKIYDLLFSNYYPKPIDLNNCIKFEFISHGDLNIINTSELYKGEHKIELIVEDGLVYTKEGEELCKVEDMANFTDFESQNECIHCEGLGYTEYGPECNKPASECCGGCYVTEECECELFYPYK